MVKLKTAEHIKMQMMVIIEMGIQFLPFKV